MNKRPITRKTTTVNALYRENLELLNRAERAENENTKLAEQNASIRGYSQACADRIAERLPGIDVQEYSLITLVNKLIAELDDARVNPKGMDKIADIVGAQPDVESIMARLSLIAGELDKSQKIMGFITEELRGTRQWLGAKDGEPTLHAAKRVVCTLEVAPGAAQQLQTIRNYLGCMGGETALEVIKRPVEFSLTVKKRKSNGEVFGGELSTHSVYPKIGAIDLTVKEI